LNPCVYFLLASISSKNFLMQDASVTNCWKDRLASVSTLAWEVSIFSDYICVVSCYIAVIICYLLFMVKNNNWNIFSVSFGKFQDRLFLITRQHRFQIVIDVGQYEV
jgi:hypothetical protein